MTKSAASSSSPAASATATPDRALALTLLAACALLAGCAPTKTYAPTDQFDVVVSSQDSVAVYRRAATLGGPAFHVPPGQAVRVTGSANMGLFYRVEHDGRTGFIEKDRLATLHQAEQHRQETAARDSVLADRQRRADAALAREAAERTATQAEADAERARQVAAVEARATAAAERLLRAERNLQDARYTHGRVNVRSGPGTGHPVVARLDREPTYARECADGWCRVEPAGTAPWTEGYVSASLLHRDPVPLQRAAPQSETRSETRTSRPSRSSSSCPARTLHRGPRGGCYYLTASGNRTYVDRACCR